jgi:hypothetical protein
MEGRRAGEPTGESKRANLQISPFVISINPFMKEESS